MSDKEVQKDEMSPVVIDWNQRYQYQLFSIYMHIGMGIQVSVHVWVSIHTCISWLC